MSPIIRTASQSDLIAIVEMLADDELGRQRERFDIPLPASYCDIFAQIDNDPNNELIVAETDNIVAGVLQLTFIPYLTYQGSWRATIEGVRIHRGFRNHGLGKILLNWAINRAKQKNCKMVQLTSDKQRPDAIGFYEKLGFISSHEGMKLHF